MCVSFATASPWLLYRTCPKQITTYVYLEIARAPIVYWGQISIKTLKVEVLLLAVSIWNISWTRRSVKALVSYFWRENCSFMEMFSSMVPAKWKEAFFHVLKEICHQRTDWAPIVLSKKIVLISSIKNYKILSCLELILCWMKYMDIYIYTIDYFFSNMNKGWSIRILGF